MVAEDKVVEYEIQITDMLQTIQARLNEFKGKKLDEFEQGRELAYIEMMDIIKTRHQMILDVLADEEL